MAVRGIPFIVAAVVVAIAGLLVVWACESKARRELARRGSSHWDVHGGDDYGHMDLDIDVVMTGEDS